MTDDVNGELYEQYVVFIDMGKHVIRSIAVPLTLPDSHLPRASKNFIFDFLFYELQCWLVYDLAVPVRSLNGFFPGMKMDFKVGMPLPTQFHFGGYVM